MSTPDALDAQRWLELAKRGRFDDAWRVSDRILARHRAAPDFTRPRHLQSIWTGDPLDGKRVLIRCYHGLGDTLQFVRYLPMVRAVAREVILWVQPPLMRLLEGFPGIDRMLRSTRDRPASITTSTSRSWSWLSSSEARSTPFRGTFPICVFLPQTCPDARRA